MLGEGGLRERKRLATRSRITRAAMRLALDQGLEAATVEAIADLAEVSPRTFFNYFESKDDALIGTQDVEISAELLEQHETRYAGAELVSSVVGLLFTVLAPQLDDAEQLRDRHELLRRHPQLLSRQVMQLMRMGEQLVAAVVHLDRASTSDPDAEARAELVLALCGTAVRLVGREWLRDEAPTPVPELQRRAVSLVHTSLDRLR